MAASTYFLLAPEWLLLAFFLLSLLALPWAARHSFAGILPVLGVGAGLGALGLRAVESGLWLQIPFLGIELAAWQQPFLLVAYMAAFLSLLWLLTIPTGKASKAYISFFLLSALLGAHVLVIANTPILSVLGLEMLSLASYVGVSWPRTQGSLGAGLRYALVGLFSSGCLLYGLSWAYGLQLLPDSGSTSLAWQGVQALLLVAVLFKMGAFPLHGWVPDAYEHALLPFVAFLSVAPKVAALGWVSHLALFGQATLAQLALPLACVGAVSVLAGNVGAFFQPKFLRLMGFSSVAHAGFMLLCLACPSPLEVAGFYALALLGINYMALGLWGQMQTMGATADLASVNGWARHNFLLAILAVLSGLALAGLPPTVGFTAKFKLVLGLAHQSPSFGPGWAYGLAGFTALNTAISLYYYLRLPYHLIFRPLRTAPAGHVSKQVLVALGVLGVLLVFFFFGGQLLDAFVRPQ